MQQRNHAYAKDSFVDGMKMMPSLKTLIVGCVDPRVDPMDVLGLHPGEAAIVRNVGGRVNEAFYETVGMLSGVSRDRGNQLGPGWNLVVLHHTDCGINACQRQVPELLAHYMGVAESDLDTLAISDPYKSVALDIETLRASEDIPGGFAVTGLVYDIATGHVEVVVPPSTLRDG